MDGWMFNGYIKAGVQLLFAEALIVSTRQICAFQHGTPPQPQQL